MPELPDLQVISRNLNKKFANKKVNRVTIYKDKKLNASAEDFVNSIQEKVLKVIKRNGKELLLEFDNQTTLGIHLMLKGEIHLLDEINIKHKIFEIEFEDNSGFSVTDFMGQAKPILNTLPSTVPDALSDEFNFGYFKPILNKSSKSNIKKILKDQEIVRGIGNAYIDEILWDARISPLSNASKIPDDQIQGLIISAKKILNEAIEEIIKISPNIISGEIRSFLKVHTSNPTSPTNYNIKSIEIDGKKTYFTDEQVLYE